MNRTAQRALFFLGILLALLSVLFSGCPEPAEPQAEEEPQEEVCLSRPCAVDDSFSVPKNFGPKVFSVLLNDLNFSGQTGGGNLSITEVSPAANGMVLITGNATTVEYTGNLDFVGQDTFTYTIVDTADTGDGPSTATVTVDVQP